MTPGLKRCSARTGDELSWHRRLLEYRGVHQAGCVPLRLLHVRIAALVPRPQGAVPARERLQEGAHAEWYELAAGVNREYGNLGRCPARQQPYQVTPGERRFAILGGEQPDSMAMGHETRD